MRKKKTSKKIIQFSMMVCGQSGTGEMINLLLLYLEMALIIIIGRTTFVNTLCDKTVLAGKEIDDPANAHLEEGVQILSLIHI